MIETVAYIDPGAGSLLLQGLAAGAAAGAVMGRLYWARLLRLLRLRRPVDGVDK